MKAISFAENGSYFVTAGNRWVDNTNIFAKQIFFNAHHWIIFQTRQVLVPGIFSQRQVQGGCSSDGKISNSWGTEKQLFLWCRMWTRRNGKIFYPRNSWQSLIITRLVSTGSGSALLSRVNPPRQSTLIVSHWLQTPDHNHNLSDCVELLLLLIKSNIKPASHLIILTFTGWLYLRHHQVWSALWVQ